MRKTITKDIKGTRYEISQLNTEKAQHHALLLARCFGAMGAAAATAPANAVAALLREITPAELASLCEDLADVTLVNGKSLRTVYGEHFAGEMAAWSVWLTSAVMHNYADFFSELVSLAADAVKT
jgi:hypothetical protein